MNPNVPEEAGKTFRSAIDALKTQPAVLAVVLLNIIFVGVVGWLTNTSFSRKDAMLLAKDQEIVALTNKCIDLAVKVPTTEGH